MRELGEAVDVGRTDPGNRRLERAYLHAGLGEQLGDNVEMFHAWGRGTAGRFRQIQPRTSRSFARALSRFRSDFVAMKNDPVMVVDPGQALRKCGSVPAPATAIRLPVREAELYE